MIKTIIKKELKEDFFAMKGIFWLAAVAISYSAMTLSFISVKELTILAQEEIVFTMSKMILGVSLLLTIILSSISFTNEKEQKTIESLMLTPITGPSIAYGKAMGIFLIWLMVFMLSVPYVLVVSHGTSLGLVVISFMLVIGSFVNLIYIGFSMSVSIKMSSTKNALLMAIILSFITALPVFYTTAMKTFGLGKLLERISPLSNASNLMQGIILNRESIVELIQYMWPIVAYLIIAVMLLRLSVKGLGFEGGM